MPDRIQLGTSNPLKILEPLRGQFRLVHHARSVSMPQRLSDGGRLVAVVGKLIAGGIRRRAKKLASFLNQIARRRHSRLYVVCYPSKPINFIPRLFLFDFEKAYFFLG